MSDFKGKIDINLAPEWEIELELQAEAAGMSKEAYMVEMLNEYCAQLGEEETPPPTKIH